MSTIKKGVLTKAGEWAKHLRPWGKRRFWHQHRKAERRFIKKDLNKSAWWWPNG